VKGAVRSKIIAPLSVALPLIEPVAPALPSCRVAPGEMVVLPA
jgi:hypothetical protein